MFKGYKISVVKNKQKPQLRRVGRPEGGALMPCDDSRAQEDSFPGKKSPGPFVYYSPPNFLFLSIKASPSLAVGGFARGSPWLQTLNYNSLLILIPNKPTFAGEISGSLFISGQHKKSSGDLLYSIVPIANNIVYLKFAERVDLMLSVLTTHK